MSFTSHEMLCVRVDVQNYRKPTKLYDIKFRKTVKFKYLELMISENDNCEVRRFKQDSVSGEKNYCRNT